MNPIFFPSTWIPESLRGCLFACFRQVTVLQPARKLLPEPLLRQEESDRLNICLPDEGTAEDLSNLLKDYHAWADLHQGERPAFHKFAERYASGPEDASTAWIRSKIRHPESPDTGSKSSPDDGEADPLQLARLFLAIAQEYDRQNEALSRDLHAIDNMERNLLRALTPDQPSPGVISAGVPSPAESAAGYPMPARRLAAWRLLYAHCRQRGNPSPATPAPFFITGDRETLSIILAPVDTPEVVCRITGIPSVGVNEPFVSADVHRKIDETLCGAVKGSPLSAWTIPFSESEACPQNAGTLTIYRIKGNPAKGELSGSERTLEPSSTIPVDNESPFTLLGYIENCTLDSSKQ